MRRYYLFVIMSILAALLIALSIEPSLPVYRYKMLDITSQVSSNCPIASKVLPGCDAYQQTTNYTCGPAAVMTVMYYYKRLSNANLNKQYEIELANSMGAIPGSTGGTTQAELADWFAKHGFNVHAGKNIKTDMLIHYIDLGIPTIVGFDGHWIVAKGYNRGSSTTLLNTDEIIFADSCCGVRKLSRYEIDGTWQNSHKPYHHCSNDNGNYLVPIPLEQ